MGIQLQIEAFQDSPETREAKKRAAFRKRVIYLTSSLTIAIFARLLIKDPPPPKVPDRTNNQVRYVPGMLNALPASERVKLDPKIVAKMMQADELARKGISPATETALAQQPYKPADSLYADSTIGQEPGKFLMQKRRKNPTTETEPVDATKTMVVQFREGGFIRAQQAIKDNQQVRIQVNRSLLAKYPTQLVSNIQTNALNWKEPVSAGFVQIKPAKGITLTLKKHIADRITKNLELSDEI